MGEDIVHRLVLEARGRDVDAALGENEEEADSLGDGGLTAAVRTGQDIDGVICIEIQVVIHDLFTVVRGDSQLQVIKTSGFHRQALFEIPVGKKGGLAERHAFLDVGLDELRESDVENELGDELGDVHDGDVDVFAEGVTELLDEGVEELVDDFSEVEGGVLDAVVFRNARCRRIRIRHVSHKDAGRGALGVHVGKAVNDAEAFVLSLRRGVVHVAVPVRALVELVLGLEGVGEVADDARLLEGGVVNGDEAEGTGLETLIDVDADGDASDATSFCLDLLDVRLHLGEEGVGVHGVDVFSQVDQTLGLEVGFSEAVLHGLHALDVVRDLVELMEKVPKAHSFGGSALHGLEVLDVGDLVQELHHLFSKVGEVQDVDEDFLPVLRHAPVGGELREDAHDQDVFLWSLGEGVAECVQRQVMAGQVTELRVLGFVTIGEQNADWFADVNCHVGPPGSSL